MSLKIYIPVNDLHRLTVKQTPRPPLLKWLKWVTQHAQLRLERFGCSSATFLSLCTSLNHVCQRPNPEAKPGPAELSTIRECAVEETSQKCVTCKVRTHEVQMKSSLRPSVARRACPLVVRLLWRPGSAY